MKVHVAVFTNARDGDPRRKPLVAAYTQWYSPDWGGYCGHDVDVERRADAKKAAIAEHRAKCMTPAGQDGG